MRAKIEALTRYEHLAKDDPYRYGYERCKADVLALLGEGTEVNPCASIFDHQWLDPKCVECGCQSLVLQAHSSPATGGEAVTEEWLRSIGWKPKQYQGQKVLAFSLKSPLSDSQWIETTDMAGEFLLCRYSPMYDDETPPDCFQVVLKTTDDVLNLLAALGVPQPTGPTSKGEG